MTSTIKRTAGAIAGTAVGIAMAGLVTSGITPAQAQTSCQWSYESGRKVVIFGDNIQAWRVDLRTQSPITVNVPDTSGRTWVKITIPRGFAEDDVQEVSCKVNDTWHTAGTA